MIWGYAGIWFGEFRGPAEDPLMAKLEFLRDHGLQAMHASLKELASMSEAERDRLGGFLGDNDLYLVPVVWFDYLDADRDAVQRSVEETIAGLWQHAELARAPIVTTCVGNSHRFARDPDLDEQMERLHEALGPIALACQEIGCPFGIENHGDYYCSDLVELCKHTPHLGIFLDTGNTYLIGEQSLPGIREAAPFTIGTHFKDHHVWPEKETYPLRFEIAGAVLGEGDVGLAEAYEILVEHAPAPDDLVMLIEMVPPHEQDRLECLERSVAFTRTLGEAGP
jgi:sugar phosphate isomerase/epimerase